MAELDPRFGPAEQNRTVTLEYLDELYHKADRLRLLERYLVELRDDPDFSCSIGGLDEWLSRQNSRSHQSSRLASMPSV